MLSVLTCNFNSFTCNTLTIDVIVNAVRYTYDLNIRNFDNALTIEFVLYIVDKYFYNHSKYGHQLAQEYDYWCDMKNYPNLYVYFLRYMQYTFQELTDNNPHNILFE